MPELSDLFDDLATSPAPPRRLSADELFTTGRRHRRRRRTAGATGTVLGLVLAVAVAIAWWPAGGNHPAPVPAASAGNGTDVMWAEVVDASHAYAEVPLCPPVPASCSESTTATVFGTDDGGRTWTVRSVVGQDEDLTALGRDVLLAEAGETNGVHPPMRLSTDGGRTWSELPDGSAPVAAVPTGGAVVCRSAQYQQQPCKLSVVDPRSRRIAPLAGQPDLIMSTAYNVVDPYGRIQPGGDRILVAGADQRTGRPAVAVSSNRGRTWSTHVFTDLPCPDPQDCGRDVYVQSTADGTTGYAVVVDAQQRRMFVYREQAGGGWTRSGQMITYGQTEDFGQAFVTTDGTHLVGLRRTPLASPSPSQPAEPELRYVTLRGGTYQPAEVDGLPGTAAPAQRAAGGVFFALDHTGQALYDSTDGWHWTPFPLVR